MEKRLGGAKIVKILRLLVIAQHFMTFFVLCQLFLFVISPKDTVIFKLNIVDAVNYFNTFS